MDNTIEFDMGQAARELGLPLASVQNTVVLLDDGNTVPFITRYRKDQTGALDEEQIRRVQEKVGRLRALAERKQTILKSIQSQGILTPELADQIRTATSSKRLEDLYLPYKPKKQTLATTARQRGLEPLAREVLEADPAAADLPARAASLVAPEQDLHSVDDVLAGVRHVIAEWFSERADARGRLRKVLQRTAKVICSRIEPATRRETAPEAAASTPAIVPTDEPAAAISANSIALEPMSTPAEETQPAELVTPETTSPNLPVPAFEAEAVTQPLVAAEPSDAVPEPVAAPLEQAEAGTGAPNKPRVVLGKLFSKKRGPLSAAMSKKEKKRQRLEAAFKDYFAFQESISRIPPHRVLAINRGERARILRVKMDADVEAMTAEAEMLLIPAAHPHTEFLRSCVRDALSRLLIPSLERELRREMAEVAEEHAVEVFARNLRKLLLQPPVHNHRVLAIDPGFRSGCKLIALDEFGNVLGHEIIHVIGKEEWIRAGRAKLVELIRRHRLRVIAIGNGAGCRETEQLIVDVLGHDLKDDEVAFVIVNEAGASVYSTSPVGREELPHYDAVLRSAISIGRRLLDPLSELVKINPANIGVGMYQHDVKAKHLRNSLDAVVESCVNYVGVDVNTASPALLRYVSGMNQLTARRLCEHRSKHGPFRSREELKQVSGLGEATFVQAAGFLKIAHGDNPLDATWIHPESYELAYQVLAKVGCSVSDLVVSEPAPAGTAAAEDMGPVILSETIAGEVPRASHEQMVIEGAAPVSELSEDTAAAKSTVEPVRYVQEQVHRLDPQTLANEMSVSELLLRDILNSLARPGRDPREDFPAPVFRRGIVKLEDLEPGMKLAGTVLNVVDFGAFVDIGLPDSGLVHISRLADRFVRDPHEVVGVGDVLTVWVVEIDKQRRRVSLTAIEPGTEKPAETRRESARPRSRKPSGKQPAGRLATTAPAARPQAGAATQRPKSHQRPRPPQKPKFVKPITKEMEEGKEPLRSFSDLMQFYQKKQSDGE